MIAHEFVDAAGTCQIPRVAATTEVAGGDSDSDVAGEGARGSRGTRCGEVANLIREVELVLRECIRKAGSAQGLDLCKRCAFRCGHEVEVTDNVLWHGIVNYLHASAIGSPVAAFALVSYPKPASAK